MSDVSGRHDLGTGFEAKRQLFFLSSMGESLSKNRQYQCQDMSVTGVGLGNHTVFP